VETKACSDVGKGLFVMSVPLMTPELSLRVQVNSNTVGSVLADEFLLFLFEDVADVCSF
jgi:hypothetical protein